MTMRGNATNLDFADGKVSAKGNVLYTYEIVNADELKLNMQGTVYRFLKGWLGAGSRYGTE